MKFVVADQSHNAGLRFVTSAIHMPGRIVLSYRREPDYFHGAGIQGIKHQTIAGIQDDEVVGYGCRSLRPMYINGHPSMFGYLSGLRSLPKIRGGYALVAGYRFLHQLHADQETPAYITTIIDENDYAKSVLTSSRFGLPQYMDWGRYITYAVNFNRRRRRKWKRKDISIAQGDDFNLQEIVSFLNRIGSKRQFYPVYDENDFHSERTRDFAAADFYIAVQQDQIVGVVGVWDQTKYKQLRIIAYQGVLHHYRKIINFGLAAGGYRPLPSPGEELKIRYAAFVGIDQDDPDILTELLEAIYHDYQAGDDHFLCIGLHEKDPLNESLKKFSAIRYFSRVYIVSWDDGRQFCRNLEKTRIPYLELAAL
ncbi:MAG: hypothetical protein EHM72_19085 [Calditrichaeota bacterium]|nr:MAG: hypothetical protein EHM72_19085 [Calditrichota bacterium]